MQPLQHPRARPPTPHSGAVSDTAADADDPLAASLAAELRAQADGYDDFARRAGATLAAAYRDLAAELRRRAETLTGRATGAGTAANGGLDDDAARITPHTREDLIAAWRVFLAMLNARRFEVDMDGGSLLDDQDPRAVLWVAVGAVERLLGTLPPDVAKAIVDSWAHAAVRG